MALLLNAGDTVSRSYSYTQPSSLHPIQPQECGERTAQLLPVQQPIVLSTAGYIYNGVFDFDGESITIMCTKNVSLALIDKHGDTIMNETIFSNIAKTVETPNGLSAMRIYAMSATDGMYIMLNSGSTALPYSPYGYKLDISSGGENLFDGTMEQGTISGWGDPGVSSARIRTANYIEIEPGVYTLNAVSDSIAGVFVFLYDIDDTFIQRIPDTWTPLPYTITIANRCKMKFVFSASGTTIVPTDVSNIMLNLGSTAKPYSPYNRSKTPIYLGEVETTRQVKKLVLTGEETFGYANNCFTMTFDGKPASVQPLKTIIICNTYNGREPVYRDQLLNYQCCITRNYNQLAIRDNNYSEVADFKAYLATQYAAGTPVTIWYVLATPETGIVNEPLMKIGEYADTLSNVSIPVTAGGDTLSVDTTVQPSEVTVNYKGWHPVADVHERDNGQWD